MRKIALFAHDAGGAEILLELLKASLQVGEFRIFSLVDSPCYTLIKTKKLKHFWHKITPEKNDIEAKLALFKPSIVLYGTGWQNHFEYYFLDYTKAHNIPSVAFLDHWTNYRERFGYPEKNWENNLPPFIAAHDQTSFDKAKTLGLPNIIAIKNYALAAQHKEAQSVLANIPENDTLLFLSEPTAKVATRSFGDAYGWGFTEKEVFTDILTFKKKFGCKNILIRLHPSDTHEVYQAIDPSATFSHSTLLEDIAHAKVVIGIDTVALYTAYLLGKYVLSYIPSNTRECCVPLPKENQLKRLEHFKILQLKTIKENPENFGMDFALFLEKQL
ncbi:hypothetical protein [Sulfurospirillum diekertiae]|uniref:Uncharacterized protein n=1 Tax=Sulfurospirillum diekertiae TaxID=1854492 RepID=A0A1Y0HRW0_9BACT|nr:hypothetical protein [Sulfurospirillum diekertiae]ARU50044.1 hypothetical protein Sdiek1_2902 [Sulfurospirillum diekertiae]ASC94832.1 hypothetical protein Sdiek2_2836 [Sulfurospirillum diekertiae]